MGVGIHRLAVGAVTAIAAAIVSACAGSGSASPATGVPAPATSTAASPAPIAVVATVVPPTTSPATVAPPTATKADFPTATPTVPTPMAPAPSPTATPTPRPAVQTTEPLIVIAGRVQEVNTRTRVITFDEPAHGIPGAALTDSTEIVAADGSPRTLEDILPGMVIQVSGGPSQSNAVLATRIRIVSVPSPGSR